MDQKKKEELLKEIEKYEKKIQKNPKKSLNYYHRGTIYYRLKSYKKAFNDFKEFINYSHNYSIYHSYDIEKFSIYLDKYYKTNASEYFSQGNRNFKLKKYLEATRNYETAIKLNPKYIPFYINNIKAYLHLENYEKVIENSNNIIKLNIDYHFYLAYFYNWIAYGHLKKYKKAIDNFNKIIELKTKKALDYAEEGNKYFIESEKTPRYKRAIENYNIAIELNPKNASFYYNRGNIYFDFEKYREAIKDYTTAIKLSSKNISYYNNKKRSTYNSEDCHKTSEFASYYSKRCYAYFNSHDYNSAIEDYKQAIKLDPKSALRVKENIKNFVSDLKEFKSIFSNGNFKKTKENFNFFLEKYTKSGPNSLHFLKEIGIMHSFIENAPKKLEGYLIFADILGWKGIWKKVDRSDITNVTVFIKNILEKKVEENLKKSECNISLISDTFIIYSKDLHLSIELSKKLIELCLENNLVIRGAISYGECYNKDTVYVGPAVDEAASWHDEGEEIGIFCTPSVRQEIINNNNIKKTDLLEGFMKLKSGGIETFFINWYNDKTKEKFYELFNMIDKTSIKVYLKYLNTEKKFDDYVND